MANVAKKPRMDTDITPMWTPTPEQIEASAMTAFMRAMNAKFGLNMTTYGELYQWSVDNLTSFWAEVWEWVGMRASTPFQSVLADPAMRPGATFFEGARLNFAENLLRFRDERVAISFTSEVSRVPRAVTYAELYQRVEQAAWAMRQMGLQPGDRVAAFLPNLPETVVCMLAATSLGAVWSSCSPDFGKQGVLDRFCQIEPRLLFAADSYFFKGKRIDTLQKTAEIVAEIPSVERVVIINYTTAEGCYQSLDRVPRAQHYDDWIAEAGPTQPLEFAQLPFDHPVYIMYSSGTTGLPKCIVQGPGVLLNHLKELVLHCGLTREDNIFYFTTTGWMMWNWLVSSLATGATIVMFEGNPLYPDARRLWRLAEDTRMTILGTSARYLAAVMAAGVVPRTEFDLSSLRTICSTGSPATTNIFRFVYEQIKPDVQFASISGGTDLNGCFALGCPILPVYDGELQCRGLGLAVDVFDDDANPVLAQQGELVCRTPFPSMPLCFYNDPEQAKYSGAYFEHFEGIWRHGDFAEITPRGGLIIYGRSDATLNPGGVRIGTADIYRVVEEQMAEVADAVVIGQSITLPDGTPDVRIVLFVQMADGAALDDALVANIRGRIRAACSPRHVPAVVMACPDVPYTVSGKKVELAVKKCVEGKAINNQGALRNPEALDFFMGLAEELKA